MRQRLAELEQHWQKYEQARLAAAATPSPDNASTEATNPQNGNTTAPGDASSVPQTARKTFAKLTAFMSAGNASDSELPSIRDLEDQLMCLR